MPQEREAYIFANGDIGDLVAMAEYVHPGPFVIAADGGIRHAMSLGLRPGVVVGDMDSAPRELIQLAERQGAEIIRHPTRKDQTDLELALDTAAERGITDVTIFGALGGRLDHSLANIMLLGGRISESLTVRIVEPGYAIHLIRNSASLDGEPGDIVTLLAITDSVDGIFTEGLEYPLHNGSLKRGSSLGVSNRLTHPQANIRIAAGSLLAVQVKGGELDESDDFAVE